MKKILFLINTLNGGGAEKVLVDTVNSLDSNKYQITVQTIFDEGINKKNLSSNIRYRSVIKTNSKFLRRIFTKILFNPFSCTFSYKVFIDDDYDYEISFLEGMPTKIISYSSNMKSKKYAWVHTDLKEHPDSYKAYGSVEKEKNAYKKYDRIFCVSENVKSAFEEKYGLSDNRLFVLYNILDDAAIESLSQMKAELPSHTKPLFISVGRLVNVKGYDRLLRIHKQLTDEGLEHSLAIIGDGDDRERLEDYIAENNLYDSVFLLGYMENPYKYISKADLFVCSSYAEGYSTVVSESIICGVPVLSTDVAGAREPFECPRCSVVADNNDIALYSALRELLEYPDRLAILKNDMINKRNVLKKDHLVSRFESMAFCK